MKNTVVDYPRLEVVGDHESAPIVITKNEIGPNLVEWMTNNKSEFSDLLEKCGAVLFRGFKINGAKQFEKLIMNSSGQPLEYKNRSTPRSQVSGNIYTSTEYPASETIPLHNENSYTHSWAKRIFFFCVRSADCGGETPIADSRKVYQLIDEKIREKFIKKRISYVRNYSYLDLPWQEVFQTEDKHVVETLCKSHGIDYGWQDNGSLRTVETCDAVQRHHSSGELIWFNQAHLFHYSSLPKEVSDSLLKSVGLNHLPRNAQFGDGSEMDIDELQNIRDAYARAEVRFPWQSGDILTLDNMLFAHGRKPYSGQRQVLVGMTDLMNSSGE